MKTLIDYSTFKRLYLLEKKLLDIPVKFTLKHSKTEGKIICIQETHSGEDQIILYWSIWGDFERLTETIKKLL